ncbi:MAG: hypothetical protein IJA60_04630, partial [Clostridia bacterium]|nr:hypothetical protein [Clostridia bacterium]
MQKKLLSVLLAICMLISMFPMALPVSAAEDTEETVTATEIGTADALIALMGDSTAWGGNYKLTADIDLTGLTQTSIGTAAVKFTGTFDGNYKTIKGLATASGLFGQVQGATIKNLTVEGTVTATANGAGGLVGYAYQSVTIENCVNKVTVNGKTRAAGFVGSLDVQGPVVIKNCVNEGTVIATGEHIGGIVGRVYPNQAGGSLNIENCVNKAKIQGTTNVAGIVGRFDVISAGSNGSYNVKNCANYGEINPTTTASGGCSSAGIIGLYSNNASSTTTVIENCYNEGNVVAEAKYVGGIIGYFRSYPTPHPTATDLVIRNNMNAGDISCTANGAATSGIVGTANGSTGGFTLENNYNCGSVVNGDDEYEAAIVAAGTAKAVIQNNYALDLGETHGVTTYTNLVTEETYASAASFAGFSTDYWIFTDNGPELKTHHTHDLEAKYVAVEGGHAYSCYCNDASTIGTTEEHVMVGGTCLVCGAADCTHATTEEVITLAPTCVATGYKNVVCTECESIVEKDVVVEIDPENHTGTDASISYDADNGCIVYTYDCCGAVIYEDWTVSADVYYATTGYTIDANTSFDGDIGTESELAFGSLDDVIEYVIASSEVNEDITVHVVDTLTLTKNFETPAIEANLTLTGGEIIFNATNRSIYANGPLTIEGTTLTAIGNCFIMGRNNKLVVGEGVVTNSDSSGENKFYLIAGAGNAGVNGVLAGDLTVRSGAWHSVVGANRFEENGASAGSIVMTVGKTNADDTLTINGLTPFGINGGAISADSYSTIIVDGEVDVTEMYASIYPTSNVHGEENIYFVNLVLKEGADITTLTGLTNQATLATAKWTVYADQRNEAAVADAALFAGNDSNITVAQSTYAVYCVDYLDGHVDANEDTACDECGSSMTCEHDNVSNVTVTPSTCATKGTANVVCGDCGTVVGQTELDLDASNHEDLDYVWSKNADTGAYEIVCSACNAAIISQEEAPTVYVAKLDAGVTSGDDANDGLTTTTGVATLEEAVKRIAATGGTVWFTARYDVSGARITLPEYTETITFRGTVNAAGNAESGLINNSPYSVINLGGPSVFENIVFKGKGINYIVANWNNLDFGYTRIHDEAQVYLIIGNYLTTADNTEAKDVTVNLQGATMSTSAASESGTSEAIFFGRVYLGDIFGANNIKTTNKKVTLNVEKGPHHEAELDVLYVMSTTGNDSFMQTTTEDCETVVNFYDATTVLRGRSGDKNVGYDDSTGRMDKITFNLYDDSTLVGDYHLKNVAETIINISTEAEGRSVKIAKTFVTMGFGAYANVPGTVTVNTDTHSFSGATIARHSIDEDAGTAYTFVNNIEDVCTWDEGEITTEATPDAAGVKTYTCTVCGKTKTEEVPYECTAHAYVAKADGTYYCANGCDSVDAPAAPVIVSVAPVTVSEGVAVATVSVKATTPIVANRFVVNAPEGFTLTAAESVLGAAGETSTGFTLTGQDAIELPYEAALLNMSVQDATIDAAVLTLTFAVAETVEDGTYIITVESLETYNLAEEAIETAAVSAEATVAVATVCTHENTTTTTVEATCTEDGSVTVTCDDCGETVSTEVIPATGHVNTTETVVEATCTEDGSKTVTCACGEVISTEVIPATGHVNTTETVVDPT